MTLMVNPQLGDRVADFACGTGGFITSAMKVMSKQVNTVEERELFNSSFFGIEKKSLPHLLCVTNMLLHDLDSPRIIHGNALEKNVREYEDNDEDMFDVILMNPPYGGNEKDTVKINFPTELRSSETADLFLSVIMFRLNDNGRCAVILPDGFMFGTDNAKTAIKTKLMDEFNLHTVIRMPKSVFAPYTPITTNILFFDKTKKTEDVWFYRMDMPDGFKNFSKTKPMKIDHFSPVVEWWNDRQEINIDGFDKSKKFSLEEIHKRAYNIDLCGYPQVEEIVLDPKATIVNYHEKRQSLNDNIDNILSKISTLLGFEL